MRQRVVVPARGLDRELGVEMIVDERRGERQDGAVDAQAVQPLDLTIQLEECGVEVEHGAADSDIDRLAFGPLDLHRELVALLHEPQEFIRHEMAVHVGDHVFTVPYKRP